MIYNKYKQSLLQALTTGVVKVALLSDAYVPNQAHEFFSDVSAQEVIGTGYAAGGQVLTGKTLTEINSLFKFDADNPVWAITGSMSARYAVFYIDTGVPGTSRLLSFFKFPVLRTTINNNFTLEIPDTGILSLQ
jgi:hypothetical protein